jgi:hypothetical protein
MFVDRPHSRNATVAASNEISDSHGFLGSGACVFRAIEKNGIEGSATDSETAVTVSMETVTGCKLAMNRRSIRRVNSHSGELCRASGFDRVARVHLGENSCRLGAQVFGACFVARESGTIENDGVDAEAREKERSG